MADCHGCRLDFTVLMARTGAYHVLPPSKSREGRQALREGRRPPVEYIVCTRDWRRVKLTVVR